MHSTLRPTCRVDVNILMYDQQMEGFRFLGVEGNWSARIHTGLFVPTRKG